MWAIAPLGNEIRYRVISRLLSRRPAPAASQPRPYAVETDKPPKTHRCSGRSGFTSSGVIPQHWPSLRTPFQAPTANAHLERWVGSVRRECLDRILIFGQRQLTHVLRVYTRHYNEHRPHRALSLRPPDPVDTPTARGDPAQVGDGGTF